MLRFLPVSAAMPFTSSSSLRKRIWFATSGREVPSVPASPQQRSESRTCAPSSARATSRGACVFIGVWQGSW